MLAGSKHRMRGRWGKRELLLPASLMYFPVSHPSENVKGFWHPKTGLDFLYYSPLHYRLCPLMGPTGTKIHAAIFGRLQSVKGEGLLENNLQVGPELF